MSDNKKPNAYFKAVIGNSIKNEYRQNANSAKHIAPYGINPPERATDDVVIEQQLVSQNPQNWLMFIENPKLHKALSTLKTEDLMIIYLYWHERYTHKEIAQLYSVTRATMTRRIARISKKIKNICGDVTF